MRSLSDYLIDAERAHGHICAGQVLGVRMAMLGLQMLRIGDPQNNKEDRKRLVTFVEIDRCATDARVADRRQAVGRADCATRTVRDEHERRDLPGGQGFSVRPLRDDVIRVDDRWRTAGESPCAFSWALAMPIHGAPAHRQ